MKIALFTDIHGNYQALSAILNDIKQNKFDYIICLGDLIGIGPSSSLCLNKIIEENIKMVLGEHELYQIKEIFDDNLSKHNEWVRTTLNEEHFKFLNSCPYSIEFMNKGRLFTFSHFFIDNEKNEFPFYFDSILDNFNQLKNIPHEYSFFGHIHDSFEINGLNFLYQCIGSSGCNNSNVTFYTILEIYDDYIKCYKKYLKYDRKKFNNILDNNNYPNKDNFMKSIYYIKG